MSFEFIKKLPTPDEIRNGFPLPKEFVELKKERDAEIKDVITGKSNKFLVIIGPCSADNESAVCDYVSRLAKVNAFVKLLHYLHGLGGGKIQLSAGLLLQAGGGERRLGPLELFAQFAL